jgi:hypothetical protein
MAGARWSQVVIQLKSSCVLGYGSSPSWESDVGHARSSVEMRIDQWDMGPASEMRVGCCMREACRPARSMLLVSSQVGLATSKMSSSWMRTRHLPCRLAYTRFNTWFAMRQMGS